MGTNVTSQAICGAWKDHDWLRLSNADTNRIARESLKEAIMQLLEDQTLEEISITDLVARAGVSRSAFYRNYASKDALIEDVCVQIVEEIIELLKSPLHREDRAAWFAEIFREIGSHERYFRVYLDTHMQLMKSSILETVCPSEGIEDHYQLVMREGAFIAILTDWFRAGMQETPERMGEMCDRMIPHGRTFGR